MTDALIMVFCRDVLKGEMAERAGFEPAVPLGSTTAFEAAAFNHSATSPPGGKRNSIRSLGNLSIRAREGILK